MAYYFLFPEKDTTIYSHPDRKKMNAGHDELLEVLKERGTTDTLLYPTRTLISFKNEEIQNTIKDIIGSSKFNDGTTQVNLNLTSANPQNLISTLNLNIYAVSESWDEGSGRYSNLPTGSNGASWKFRNNTTVAHGWQSSSGQFASDTTGSISSLLTQGGGTWYTSSSLYVTQQFLVGESLDINVDVTSIVKKHSASLFASQTYPTGIINNGFLIKKPENVENNVSHSFGELQYFSTDTHTIHPPKLIFKWDDSDHQYQGLAEQEGELNVSLYRNKQEYNQNDEAKFRIHIRDKYPVRQFVSSSNYLNVGYFTTSSFFSIRDAYTEQEVIPFDTSFTKLSADSDGMFFKLNMKGLQPERYYRVLFKHINKDGTVVYDNDYYFKVVR